MIFAQLSDIHLDLPGSTGRCGINTGERLHRVVDRLNTVFHRPEFVIISGDLVNDPSPERYAFLRTLLDTLTVPYFLMVGNHDDREMLRTQFPDHAYLHTGFAGDTGFVQYEIRLPTMSSLTNTHRIVITDTLKNGFHSGHLCDKRLTDLHDMLTVTPDLPTIVALHHPPFLTGIAGIDKYCLENATHIADILRNIPGVKYTLSGHVHRNVVFHDTGFTASICPAVSVEFGLDPDPTGERVTYSTGSAGFQLHEWKNDGSLLTHTVYV